MKRWFLLAGALLFAPALGAQSGNVGIQSKKLANGLEVLVIENHAVPLVTIELDVKNAGVQLDKLQIGSDDHATTISFDQLAVTLESLFRWRWFLLPDQQWWTILLFLQAGRSHGKNDS